MQCGAVQYSTPQCNTVVLYRVPLIYCPSISPGFVATSYCICPSVPSRICSCGSVSICSLCSYGSVSMCSMCSCGYVSMCSMCSCGLCQCVPCALVGLCQRVPCAHMRCACNTCAHAGCACVGCADMWITLHRS